MNQKSKLLGLNLTRFLFRALQLRDEAASPDPCKSAGLSKKMKEISLTMRRKMVKKHAKSLSEETVSPLHEARGGVFTPFQELISR